MADGLTDQQFFGSGSATSRAPDAPPPAGGLTDQDFFGDDYRPPDPEAPASLKSVGEQFGYGVEEPFTWVAGKAGAPPPPQTFDPTQNPARNFPERVSRAAGQTTGITGATMAAGATLPEDVAGGAVGFFPSALRVARSIFAPRPSASGLVGAAASGAGGEATSESVDPNAHPWLHAGANIAGGVAAPLGLGAATSGMAAIMRDAAMRSAAFDAAKTQGVDFPRFMASTPLAGASKLASKLPGSTPINEARTDLSSNIGDAQTNLASKIGSGDPSAAAAQVGQSLRDFGPASKVKLNNQAAAVQRSFTNPDATADLANTRDLAQKILNEREGAYGTDPNVAMTPGIDHVLEAATRPGGLTYNQMDLLRRELWDQPETASNDVSRLYGALTDDMSEAAFQAGGLRGQQMAKQFKSDAMAVINQRNAVQKMIGGSSNENIYNSIVKAASDRPGQGNLEKLDLAKKVLSPQDWDELTSGAIARLGRKNNLPNGDFDPNKFLTDWNSLSPEGKTKLYGPPGTSQVRDNLDQLSTLSGFAKGPGAVSRGITSGSHIAGSLALLEPVISRALAGDIKGAVITGGAAAVTAGAAHAAGHLIAASLARPATSTPLTQLLRASHDFAGQATQDAAGRMYAAATRYAASLNTSFGVRVGADDILNAINPSKRSGPQKQ
jgi:hypothetical protein